MRSLFLAAVEGRGGSIPPLARWGNSGLGLFGVPRFWREPGLFNALDLGHSAVVNGDLHRAEPEFRHFLAYHLQPLEFFGGWGV